MNLPDIAIINLRPGTAGVDSPEFVPTQFVVEQTAQKARFSLTCAGLFDSDPGTEDGNEDGSRSDPATGGFVFRR